MATNWNLTDVLSGTLRPTESKKSLLEKLEDMNSQCAANPTIVELIAPDGATLVIGVGGRQSYLSYIHPAGWPAFTSVGDPAAEGVMPFSVNGCYTELQRRCAIPHAVAFEAAAAFFETGNQPPVICWERN